VEFYIVDVRKNVELLDLKKEKTKKQRNKQTKILPPPKKKCFRRCEI
jgi:hypothetical protein